MSNLNHIPTGDSVGALPSDRSDPLLLLDYLRLQPCVHLLHVGHHEPPRPHEVRGLSVRPHLRHLQRYPRLHLRRQHSEAAHPRTEGSSTEAGQHQLSGEGLQNSSHGRSGVHYMLRSPLRSSLLQSGQEHTHHEVLVLLQINL